MSIQEVGRDQSLMVSDGTEKGKPNVLSGEQANCGPGRAFPEGARIEKYADYELPSLNYRPFFLQDWVLVFTIIVNVGWMGWLALAYSRSLWQGPDFILGGLFSGYFATATRFFLTQQVFCLGKITPYRNMLSSRNGTVKRTIDSDYWPYEWPILRFRALRNEDYFFQGVDILAFFFTSAVVQFESNILGAAYGYDGNFIGYSPNHGIMIIVLVCHAVFVVTTGSVLVWLHLQETGLRADPGSLSLYLGLFNSEEIREDFQGFEDEDRRWVTRKRLERKYEYYIGYWSKEPNEAVYGIRRRQIPQSHASEEPTKVELPRSKTKYPEFRYVPWFIKPFWIAIWTSVLAAALTMLSTLVVRDDIIDNGFDPHVSTTISPFFKISPAAFLWSFLPSFIADLFYILVYSIDTFYRLVQPYADLKRKNAEGDAIINCFRINYVNDLPFIVTLRAFKNGHIKVAVISLFSLFASLTPAWAANMFYVGFDEWMVVWTTYFNPVLVYMSLLIGFLLLTIPGQSRHMPRDLETIADHMALFSQSSLLDKGHFQVQHSLKPHYVKPQAGFRAWIKSAIAAFTLIPESCRTVKRDGWAETCMRAKKALIGPPKFVDEVTDKMRQLLESRAPEEPIHEGQSSSQGDCLPRFGIWREREENSYVVGIDSNTDSKMISLFEDEFYKVNFREFMRSMVEHIF